MLYEGDICAHARRISDGKIFSLGLAELQATDTDSPDYRLLADYRNWFMNTL